MLTIEQKLAAIRGMIQGKRFWLKDFSFGKRKRPDHEIHMKQNELTALQEIEQDYLSVQQKRGAA